MGCNPIQFILWLVILIFLSFIVGFFCAPLYVIVHCLSGFLSPLSDLADLLLKACQFPRYCVDKMLQSTKIFFEPDDGYFSNMRNVEIKASIQDWKAINEKAKELGNSDPTIIEQTDTFFKVQKGRLKLRQFEDGSGELIFYERPDTSGPKLSEYTKASFNREGCKGLSLVLAAANGVVGIVKKTRYLYTVGQSRVHVDRVDNLGIFAEIEVVLEDNQTVEMGREISKDLMEKLGIRSNDLISQAYLDLLLAKTL